MGNYAWVIDVFMLVMMMCSSDAKSVRLVWTAPHPIGAHVEDMIANGAVHSGRVSSVVVFIFYDLKAGDCAPTAHNAKLKRFNLWECVKAIFIDGQDGFVIAGRVLCFCFRLGFFGRRRLCHMVIYAVNLLRKQIVSRTGWKHFTTKRKAFSWFNLEPKTACCRNDSRM